MNDLTSKSLIGSIKLLSIIFGSIVSVITLIGVIIYCNVGYDESCLLFFGLTDCFLIVLSLPDIIYCVVKYKRFKKLLKSSDVLYGNLDEMQSLFLIWRPFILGCRLIINGQYTLCIYSYRLVKRMVNKRVAYIFDGDTAYLLREAE